MKRKRLHKRGWILLLPLLLVIGCTPVWQTYRVVQQQRLNYALIVAVKRSDIPAVTTLLKQGADANARDLLPDPRSFWHHLMDDLRGKYSPTVPLAPTALLLVLERYVYVDGELYTANADSLPENPRLVELLLDYRADPNCKQPFDEHPETPLTIACGDLKWETARTLIDRGADVNVAGYLGFTPLLLAAFHNNAEMVDFLLHHGAQPDVREGGNHWSPVMYAIAYRNTLMLQSLLQAHADPNLKSNTGLSYEQTPLAYARRLSARAQTIHLLKRAGAKE
jgi:uncharacterized protein